MKRVKLLPGNAKRAVVVELPVYIALSLLGSIDLKTDHLSEIEAIALVRLCYDSDEAAGTVILTIEKAIKSVEDTGVIYMSDDDIKMIKGAVPRMVQFLAAAPNISVEAAIKAAQQLTLTNGKNQ